MMQIATDGQAEQELNEAIEWYETQKLGLGLRFGRELRKFLRTVAGVVSENPDRYRRVGRHARQARVPGWPYYSIYFTVDHARTKLTVLSVFHSRRDPDQLRRRLD
jgi:plasmid stabilization system protein ParE